MTERAPQSAEQGEAEVVIPSFDDVYRTHVRFVWRSLVRLGVSAADIEDAAHEAFMVVHRRLSEFDGRASPRAWLFGIARGVARNRHRSHERREERLRLLPVATNPPSLDDLLDARRAVDAMQRFLSTLDERHRLVFELSEIEGFRAPEIASALQDNLNTVNTRLRRARIAFARWLDGLVPRDEEP